MFRRHSNVMMSIAASLSVGLGLLIETAHAWQDDGPAAKWNVAIVVHEGVELLDFAGPGEVFEAASDRATLGGRSWFHVYTVAPAAGPIVSQNFLTIVPEFTIKNAPPPDILVIPGGATGVLTRDEAFMKWVEQTLPDNDLTLTVCTGAFVLGELGALDGRTVTTHWGSLNGLRNVAQDATVLEDVRFVDSGDIVTSAGVSAGIDGSLHVVARLLGLAAAEETARYMEYDWRPTDEQRAGYSELNPQLDALGQALQRGVMARQRGRTSQAIEIYEEIAAEHPDSAEALYELGRLLHLNGRLDEAIPLHRRAATAAEDGSQFQRNALYNLGCALALTDQPEAALEALHECAAAGYDGAQWAKGDSDLDSLRDREEFKHFLADAHINRARNLMGWNVDNNALDELEGAAALGYNDFSTLLSEPAFQRIRAHPRFRALQREHSSSAQANLVTPDEPGTPMEVRGEVRDASGRPVAGALVYVFHADDSGHYTPEKPMDEPNARLYAFLRTDQRGQYEFRTIRPGWYPGAPDRTGVEWEIPAHIHFDITAEGFARRRFQMVFEDDPRMSPQYWRDWAAEDRNPIIAVRTDGDGVQHAICDIVLER